MSCGLMKLKVCLSVNLQIWLFMVLFEQWLLPVWMTFQPRLLQVSLNSLISIFISFCSGVDLYISHQNPFICGTELNSFLKGLMVELRHAVYSCIYLFKTDFPLKFNFVKWSLGRNSNWKSLFSLPGIIQSLHHALLPQPISNGPCLIVTNHRASLHL